jgi:hypothetical protein
MDPISTGLCCLSGAFTMFRILRKVKCNSGLIKVVILPHSCGKSTFIRSVSSDVFTLLDLESNVAMSLEPAMQNKIVQLRGDPSFNLTWYPLVKTYLDGVKKAFKKKNLLLFISDPELATYLKIDKKDILSLIPSNAMANQISGKLSPEDRAVFEDGRMQLLLKHYNLQSFNSWAELSEILRDLFDIKVKL